MEKKKQENELKGEYDLALHAQRKGRCWYIDSGCSKHMIGDQNKFLDPKKGNGGSVTFGDNVSTK